MTEWTKEDHLKLVLELQCAVCLLKSQLDAALARAARAEKLCVAARAWVEVPGKIDNHPDALDAEDALLAALESYLLAERDALIKERAEQAEQSVVVAP